MKDWTSVTEKGLSKILFSTRGSTKKIRFPINGRFNSRDKLFLNVSKFTVVFSNLISTIRENIDIWYLWRDFLFPFKLWHGNWLRWHLSCDRIPRNKRSKTQPWNECRGFLDQYFSLQWFWEIYLFSIYWDTFFQY